MQFFDNSKQFKHTEIDRKMFDLDFVFPFAINRAYKFPASDGTAEYVLKTNGSGALAWSDVGSIASTNKVKVSSNDTTAGYLNGKLVQGTGITLTENNDGGNETLSVATTITQYTDEMAEDAVGAMIASTNTITLTYTDVTPELKADLKYQDTASVDLADDGSGLKATVIPAGIDHGALGGLTDDDHTQYILVDGTRAFTGNVTIGDGSSLYTYWYSTDNYIYGSSDVQLDIKGGTVLSLIAGSNERINISGTDMVFNEGGHDYNFRFETDTDQNALYINGDNDRVGIGTNTPSTKLEVAGDTYINSTSTTAFSVGTAVNVNTTDGRVCFHCADPSSWIQPVTVIGNMELSGGSLYFGGNYIVFGGVGTGEYMYTTNAYGDTASLVFATNSNDRLRVANAGDITIFNNLNIGGSNMELRFYEGANYVGFEAPALTADTIFVLPTGDGNAGDILKTDGSKNLSWVAPSAAAAGGSDTQIQYNDGGSINGATGLTWDDTNSIFNITGQYDGWVASGETWTRDAALDDDPTYGMYIAGDLTSKYSVGMKIKVTDTTTKYFIVTAIDYNITRAVSTTMFLYGGTDYDLAGNPTAVWYSTTNAQGFPLEPTKWTVEVSDTSNREQATPTQGQWYNTGSISIDIPIGCWKTDYNCLAGGKDTSTSWVDTEVTLSTANNSESDVDFTSANSIFTSTNETKENRTMCGREKYLSLSSKTTYYLNIKTLLAGITDINIDGATAKTIIRAVCAYL